MKRKITIAGFFVTILVLAQLIVTPPTALADDGDDHLIGLSNDEVERIDRAIENFSDTEYYDNLHSIFYDNLNENNEFSTDGLSQMISYLHQVVENTVGYDYHSTMSLLELFFMFAAMFVVMVATTPVYVAILIMEDYLDLIDYYMTLFNTDPEFFPTALLHKFAPQLYALLLELGVLTDYYIDLPETDEEKKAYIREKFREIMDDFFVGIAVGYVTYFCTFYMLPRLGYIGRFSFEFATLIGASLGLIKHAKIAIETFQTVFINPIKAFINFMDPKNGDGIILDFIDFKQSIEDAIDAANQWMYGSYGLITADITLFVMGFTDLYVYYLEDTEDKPWIKHIEVWVDITKDADTEVEVYFKNDPLQTSTATVPAGKTSKLVEIVYLTNITDNPGGLHEFTVVTDTNGVIKQRTLTAFSDGEITIEMNCKAKSANPNILTNLQLKIAKVFDHIFDLFNFPILEQIVRSYQA